MNINLKRRYPNSRTEDITDAFSRGFEVGYNMAKTDLVRDSTMLNANEIESLAHAKVREFALDTRNKGQYPNPTDFEVVTVWKCYILGNMKLLITTSLPDGKYYEVTYDFGKDSMYFDVYVRVHNEEICNLDAGETPEDSGTKVDRG